MRLPSGLLYTLELQSMFAPVGYSMLINRSLT
jgi:hypothetical protein